MVSSYEKDISEKILNLPYKTMNEYYSPIKDSIIDSNFRNLNIINDFESLFIGVFMKKE